MQGGQLGRCFELQAGRRASPGSARARSANFRQRLATARPLPAQPGGEGGRTSTTSAGPARAARRVGPAEPRREVFPSRKCFCCWVWASRGRRVEAHAFCSRHLLDWTPPRTDGQTDRQKGQRDATLAQNPDGNEAFIGSVTFLLDADTIFADTVSLMLWT